MNPWFETVGNELSWIDQHAAQHVVEQLRPASDANRGPVEHPPPAPPPPGPARNRYLARFELSLEASRNADLAAVMRELRAVTLRRRAARIRAVYPEATEQQADAIASLLTGIAFDRLTLEVPAMDTAAIARAVLRGFLE